MKVLRAHHPISENLLVLSTIFYQSNVRFSAQRARVVRKSEATRAWCCWAVVVWAVGLVNVAWS